MHFTFLLPFGPYVQTSSHVKFGNNTINDCTATRLFSKASCHRSPTHEPTTAPPIPCVPSSPGKLHNTAHATRRRRAPPSSFFDAHETFPHQSRPSILNAPAKTFSTRHTEHVSNSNSLVFPFFLSQRIEKSPFSISTYMEKLFQ